MNFRQIPLLVKQADTRLENAEGHGLERLVKRMYAERSRLGFGSFGLTRMVQGWGDRNDTELDFVAEDADNRVVRLGSCKWNPSKLLSDLSQFDGHVGRFIAANHRYERWSTKIVAIAPEFNGPQRAKVEQAGYIAEDLGDLMQGL